ncbi:hypothetical protein [Vibrio algivorus]|uniref:Uncharacterized protein n=1 Tax=Vibrio algivorus TaxID=1667024 RepID=A0A557P362_9VIBR|nr:hypothetical protein [Vibrio algivorus]TVO35077.1 hypothetical protein FOF44_12300 [Vibrio algivorus]
MNPLLMLLLQQMAGNQNTQQNPLMALLGGNQQQDPTQQLIAALSGVTGQQSNALNPQLLQMLTGNQQPQQNQNGGIQQLMQLLGNQQQQPQNQNTDIGKLLEALNVQKQEKTDLEQLAELLKGTSSGSNDNQEDDVLSRMQNKAKKKGDEATSTAEMSDAIKYVMSWDKFIEDNSDMLPDWFDPQEVKEDIDKWAKDDIERAQGLAAATSKAFFKNESMLDLLEEKDRMMVKEHILKDGLKSHEIDRGIAWPIINRAVFNKNKLEDSGNGAPQIGKGEEVIANYEARFKTGQQVSQQQATA